MEEERTDFFARRRNRIGIPWRAVLILGVITLIIGILAIVYPRVTLGVIGVLFGVQLLLLGVFQLAFALSGADRHRTSGIILGVLAIVVGILCLREVTHTAVILTLILGIYWVVHGIMLIVMAVGNPLFPNGGLAVLTGILSLIAGILILCFPRASALAIAIILGVWLVVLGLLEIVGAFWLRKIAKKRL